MSRSYKKNMGDTWACGADKYSRNMYQRSYRRRANRYCQQGKDNYEVEQIFDKELFGLVSDWRHSAQNVWERYNAALSGKNLWTYYFVELIVFKNLPKRQFESCDDLVLWLRENQKWLISLWKKINYGK